MARRSAPMPPAHDMAFAETLELVAIADLTPHPRNPRTHPPEELAHLVASLQTNGLYKNVVIAQDGTLLAGHGVVDAADQLGWTQIAVKRLPYAPDHPEALKVLVGDNEQAKLAGVHNAAMATLVAEMQTWDPTELLGTGWDAVTLAALAQQHALPRLQEGELASVEPPETFQEYGEDIPTDYCCPRCGYMWKSV